MSFSLKEYSCLAVVFGPAPVADERAYYPPTLCRLFGLGYSLFAVKQMGHSGVGCHGAAKFFVELPGGWCPYRLQQDGWVSGNPPKAPFSPGQQNGDTMIL